jgi:hypothetical protein
MNKLFLGIVLLALSLRTSGQKSLLLNYDWEKNPKPTELREDERKYPAVVVKQRTMNEIFYLENGDPVEYYLGHFRKKILTDEALEKNNKIYLPEGKITTDKFTIIEKARIIKKDGKIINFNRESILEEVDEEKEATYRFFAFEGLELNDEIEYFYVYPTELRINGVYTRFQSDDYKRRVEFVNIMPNNLINSFKSYNGFPEVVLDSSYEDIRYSYANAENLLPLKPEKFAVTKPYSAAVMYYMAKNTARSGSIDHYANVAKNWGKIINDIDFKKDGITALVKKMKLDNSLDQQKKIRFVEDYIKKTIQVLDISNNDNLSTLKFITSKNVANERGITKLLAAVFSYLNIPFEIVFTTSRAETIFDPDFPSPYYLDKPLIYFPDIKSYLLPMGLNFRLGYIPSQFTENYGLFIRFVDIANIKSGIGKIKFIESTPTEKNLDILKVNFTFDKLPNSSKIVFERELHGMNANDVQTLYYLYNDETKKEVLVDQSKYFDKNFKTEKSIIENTNVEDFGNIPLKYRIEGTSAAFVEKAGNEFLFKIGELIGPQAEMYQEEERKLPVYRDENKIYRRIITINIPDGYEFDNLENLNMNLVFDHDNKKDIGFISSYKIEGNQLIVNCEEYYYKLTQPIEKYADFVKVINAAADFNKVTLVLKKK